MKAFFPQTITKGMDSQIMKRVVWIAMLFASIAQVGCNNSGSSDKQVAAPETSGSSATQATAASPASAPKLASAPAASNAAGAPSEIVAAFLDSMRSGNAQKIESLLSTPARAEIKRQELEISPIGSPKALFKIGDSQMVEPDVALVESTWTEEVEETKELVVFNVVWELRKEAEGWRICSLAIDDPEDKSDDIKIVNFENLSGDDTGVEQRVASLPNGSVPPPNGAGAQPAPQQGFPQSGGAQLPNGSVNGVPQQGLGSFGPGPALPGSAQPGFPPNSNQPTGLPPAGGASLPPAFPPANNGANSGVGANSGFGLPPQAPGNNSVLR